MIINQIVSGGGSTPAHYIEKTVDANGLLRNGSSIIDLTGVTDIWSYCLHYAYYNNSNLTGDIIFNVKKISGQYACEYMIGFPSGTDGINSFSSNVETITGTRACAALLANQTLLTSLDLRYLVSAGGNSCFDSACNGCNQLLTAKIDSLKVLSGTLTFRNAFRLSKISVLNFPAITTLSFGSNINQFTNMCVSVQNITLHFPSNVQSVIEGLTGYSTTTPFGATSGTVLFDLPATVILTGANSTNYERNPKDDTTTALAWRVQDGGTVTDPIIDWTPFYTSGTSDPAVGDVIYSDSACTTAVTTISSIS